MIGNIIQKVVDFLHAWFTAIAKLLKDAVQSLLNFLGQMFTYLFNLLVSFFEVIYDLIRGLLYLIYMAGVLISKFFVVLLHLARTLWSFVQGLTVSLKSMVYMELPSAGHGYSGVIGHVAVALEYYQMDTVAYILLFLVWIGTAIAVIKIISSLKG